MITLKVPDMTCGHCARSVTSAITGLDPAAKVQVDLASKQVVIESQVVTAAAGAAAIAAAGFTPDGAGAGAG